MTSSFETDFSLEGAREMEKVLAKLPRELAEKAIINAARAGSNVIKKEVKATAPVSDFPTGKLRKTAKGGRGSFVNYGKLRDNIKVSRLATGESSVTMGIHTGKAYWGMFLEIGTSKRSATPFMRPAFERSAKDALDKVGDRLEKNINKTAEKLAGKFSKSGLSKKR